MSLREEINEKVKSIFHETFEIPLEKITPEAKLFEELDLDSIDVIDLVVMLEKYTSKKIDEESLKSVRTVEDVINAVEKLVSQG